MTSEINKYAMRQSSPYSAQKYPNQMIKNYMYLRKIKIIFINSIK